MSIACRMPSLAEYHFPRIVWKDNRKLLWNPILKKMYKNRPEERVRLRIIDALIEAGWSGSRISTEESIRAGNGTGGRTDIICYDRNFSPKILIECKAESVPISAKVAEQTSRYNRAVDASYLLLSNGNSDFWYHIREGKKITRLSDVPDFLAIPVARTQREFLYWRERGFTGKKAGSELREWLTTALNKFWFTTEGKIQFLGFENSPVEYDLYHYFKIFNQNESKVAISFLSTSSEDTRLVAVFNRLGKNAGMLQVDLDRLIAGDKSNTVFYSSDYTSDIDIRDFSILDKILRGEETISRLHDDLNSLFDRLKDNS